MQNIIITVTPDSLCHAEIQISWSPFPKKDFAYVLFMTEWAEYFSVVWSNYIDLAECSTIWWWHMQNIYCMNLLLEWIRPSGGKAPLDCTLIGQHTVFITIAVMFQLCIYSNYLTISSKRGQNLFLQLKLLYLCKTWHIQKEEGKKK